MTAPLAPPCDPCSPAVPRRALGRHVRETVRLAFPVMVARSGNLIMITSDVIMTSRLSAAELAFYGLGYGVSQVLFVMGLGAMYGVAVLVSQADGLGHPERCGTVWRVALAHGLALGLFFAALTLLGERFFLLTGQEAGLAAEGGRAALMFGLGLPAALMYLATAMFLEGIRRPLPNMVLMLVANGANIALNWLLVYDHGTFGGLGATGAALATSVTRWGLVLGLAGYVVLMADGGHYGVRGPLHYAVDFARKLRRLGLPLGVAQGLESGSFATVILFAGLLGSLPLATYQIANNLFTNVFMLAIGIAAATSVRVGHAVGRLDRREVQRAGWVGAGLCFCVLFALCAVFIAVPGPLASIYTGDATVQAATVPVIMLAGIFLIVDGGQGVMVGALRGTGDIWIPSAMAVGGFWGVNVPLGYHLAFAGGLGVPGLFWGLIAGAGTASVLLIARFAWISRREVRPV